MRDINFLYCTINATIINTLTKQFHLDEKMLTLSSSFTLLNVFEKKKGIMKNSSL